MGLARALVNFWLIVQAPERQTVQHKKEKVTPVSKQLANDYKWRPTISFMLCHYP
jgi:hypothetical protein